MNLQDRAKLALKLKRINGPVIRENPVQTSKQAWEQSNTGKAALRLTQLRKNLIPPLEVRSRGQREIKYKDGSSEFFPTTRDLHTTKKQILRKA